MTTSFEAIGLASPLLQALATLNISEPTPVQADVLPLAIAGGDLMVSSKTGSGKTFAFLLPTMHRMMAPEQSPLDALAGPEALVLCPTRELAQQVSQDAINLVRHHKGLRIATVVGGMPYGKQMAGLRGARLVVGTPGRLLDLAQQGKLNLSTVHTLIVDEADRMLDLGFAEDLEALDRLCGNRTQTMMFSATFAKRITTLAERIMNEPRKIELAAPNETNADIAQKLMWADSRGHKRKLLDHWLGQPDIDQAVIFTSTQIDAENLARDLMDEGVRACALHGAMPQVVRNRRLASVRKGDIKILVATDVAARGLDVPTISHVINYGMPMKPEDYVHRIGRTGRAGRTGVAVTLAESEDIIRVRAIERFISARIPEEQVEGLEPRGNFDKAPRSNGKRGGGGGGRPGGFRNDGRSNNPGQRFAPRPEGFNSDRGERKHGDRPAFGNREGGERSFGGERKFGDRPAFGNREGGERSFGGERKFGDRPAYGNREGGERSFGGERKFGDRPAFGNREGGERKFGERSFGGERKFGDRPAFGNREGGERSFGGERKFGDRPAFGERKFGDRPAFGNREGGDRKFGDRPNRGESKGGSWGKPAGTGDAPRSERGGFARRKSF